MTISDVRVVGAPSASSVIQRSSSRTDAFFPRDCRFIRLFDDRYEPQAADNTQQRPRSSLAWLQLGHCVTGGRPGREPRPRGGTARRLMAMSNPELRQCGACASSSICGPTGTPDPKAAEIELAQLAEASTAISTLTFRTAIQVTTNAILDPTDCKKLQSRSGFGAGRLAAHLKTLVPFACRRFMLNCTPLYCIISFDLITGVCTGSAPRRPSAD
ncbi:hypothetical protein ACVI1L_004676 [Bradyrhizobium sp. USDA 4516]